ncbi:MAG: calcium/sodium antiporter [Spirochaetaceae bacterium]|nr:calcium/sodium antiporter [Spirochaetaceae bacterium]
MLDELLITFVQGIPAGIGGFVILFGIILATLFVLGKGADILVDEAVLLSVKWGIPKMIIGATIVSLGTTLPEVTVSVLSALKGSAGLAMGNAVGSVICNTGLILGTSSLIAPLPFKKDVVSKPNLILCGSAILLILCSFVFKGRVPQYVGFVFLVLLTLYLIWTIKGVKTSSSEEEESADSSTLVIVLKLILGVVLVVLSSKILIPTVQETALRCRIPETVIAATLVAFGTSLPELITGITSARKGHGDLAIGNVIGANILNILFVVGAAASVTRGGLAVEKNFFYLLYPSMLFMLLVLLLTLKFSKDSLKRGVGLILLLSYLAVTVLSYFV